MKQTGAATFSLYMKNIRPLTTGKVTLFSLSFDRWWTIGLLTTIRRRVFFTEMSYYTLSIFDAENPSFGSNRLTKYRLLFDQAHQPAKEAWAYQKASTDHMTRNFSFSRLTELKVQSIWKIQIIWMCGEAASTINFTQEIISDMQKFFRMQSL